MKFVFTGDEVSIMHRCLAAFAANAAQRPMRRHAEKLAKKFTPEAKFISLSPSEVQMLGGIATRGVKNINEQLDGGLVPMEFRERAASDVAAFKTITEKLLK